MGSNCMNQCVEARAENCDAQIRNEETRMDLHLLVEEDGTSNEGAANHWYSGNWVYTKPLQIVGSNFLEAWGFFWRILKLCGQVAELGVVQDICLRLIVEDLINGLLNHFDVFLSVSIVFVCLHYAFLQLLFDILDL